MSIEQRKKDLSKILILCGHGIEHIRDIVIKQSPQKMESYDTAISEIEKFIADGTDEVIMNGDVAAVIFNDFLFTVMILDSVKAILDIFSDPLYIEALASSFSRTTVDNFTGISRSVRDVIETFIRKEEEYQRNRAAKLAAIAEDANITSAAIVDQFNKNPKTIKLFLHLARTRLGDPTIALKLADVKKNLFLEPGTITDVSEEAGAFNVVEACMGFSGLSYNATFFMNVEELGKYLGVTTSASNNIYNLLNTTGKKWILLRKVTPNPIGYNAIPLMTQVKPKDTDVLTKSVINKFNVIKKLGGNSSNNNEMSGNIIHGNDNLGKGLLIIDTLDDVAYRVLWDLPSKDGKIEYPEGFNEKGLPFVPITTQQYNATLTSEIMKHVSFMNEKKLAEKRKEYLYFQRTQSQINQYKERVVQELYKEAMSIVFKDVVEIAEFMESPKAEQILFKNAMTIFFPEHGGAIKAEHIYKIMSVAYYIKKEYRYRIKLYDIKPKIFKEYSGTALKEAIAGKIRAVIQGALEEIDKKPSKFDVVGVSFRDYCGGTST